MIKLNKINVRFISLFLVIATLFTSMPLSIIATEIPFVEETNKEETDASPTGEDCAKVTLLHNGAEKSSVTIEKDKEETLSTFVTDIQPTGYVWQILIPDENIWVDIQGRIGTEIKVSYSLIGSMLNDSDRAYIRISEL